MRASILVQKAVCGHDAGFEVHSTQRKAVCLALEEAPRTILGFENTILPPNVCVAATVQKNNRQRLYASKVVAWRI
jgi:hypothetical protein